MKMAEFSEIYAVEYDPEPHEIQTLYDNYVRIGGTPLPKDNQRKKWTWFATAWRSESIGPALLINFSQTLYHRCD